MFCPIDWNRTDQQCDFQNRQQLSAFTATVSAKDNAYADKKAAPPRRRAPSANVPVITCFRPSPSDTWWTGSRLRGRGESRPRSLDTNKIRERPTGRSDRRRRAARVVGAVGPALGRGASHLEYSRPACVRPLWTWLRLAGLSSMPPACLTEASDARFVRRRRRRRCRRTDVLRTVGISSVRFVMAFRDSVVLVVGRFWTIFC